jgi:hypothetical protein
MCTPSPLHAVRMDVGPVGVDAEQYICWGAQENLLNHTMYQLLSEGDARIAVNELYSNIYQWTRKYSICDLLIEDSRKYIRQKIQDATSDHF